MNSTPDVIKKLLANLPNLSLVELAKIRLKVVSQMAGQAELETLKDAIDEHLLSKMDLPDDGWTASPQGVPRFRINVGQKLAVVYRIDTHGQDKGEYGIEVFGETLNEFPRSVAEARAIADSRIQVADGRADM